MKNTLITSSKYAIPFRRFGYLVRYNPDEVASWLRKNNMNVAEELN